MVDPTFGRRKDFALIKNLFHSRLGNSDLQVNSGYVDIKAVHTFIIERPPPGKATDQPRTSTHFGGPTPALTAAVQFLVSKTLIVHFAAATRAPKKRPAQKTLQSFQKTGEFTKNFQICKEGWKAAFNRPPKHQNLRRPNKYSGAVLHYVITRMNT